MQKILLVVSIDIPFIGELCILLLSTGINALHFFFHLFPLFKFNNSINFEKEYI